MFRLKTLVFLVVVAAMALAACAPAPTAAPTVAPAPTTAPAAPAPSRAPDADAGPTGNPWVDSNGWKIRLESARHPGARVWVDASPKGPVSPDSYALALADSAAYGGRWIVSLDGGFAADVARGKADALASWKKMTGSAKFFEDLRAWSAYTPEAVVGIISDFTGDNDYMAESC